MSKGDRPSTRPARLSLGQRLRRVSEAIRSTGLAAKANFFSDPTSEATVLRALLEWAAQSPDDRFLWWEGSWTSVGQFATGVRARAAHLHAFGLQKGQNVAIVRENSPSFLIEFFALMYLGVRPALVNPQLRADALAHAMRAADCVALSCDEALIAACEACGYDPSLGSLPPLEPKEGPNEPVFRAPAPHRAQLDEVAAFIFTSGTTGLPKAARMKHRRFSQAGLVFGGLVQFTSFDCIYCCLPLFHANAIAIAVPNAILHRGRIALAPRFSGRRFWSDCRESAASSFIYVGELLRYLLNREPGPDERDHQVTRILGNGLATTLWPEVEMRFGIHRIAEYYAATEGNAETMNLLNRRGSIGPYLPWKMAIIAWDETAAAPQRTASGRARLARPNEAGLLVGRISARNEFAGYRDDAASQAKVLRGLFREKDAWFNSGDLVRFDWTGHLFFVDRLGDTFRWKSENVSTTQIAALLASDPQVREATVYGVALPGHEGRAGMAALVLSRPAEFEGRLSAIFSGAPAAAWPRFLRIVDSLEVTGTFKHRKQALRLEGIAPTIEDQLWVLDLEMRRYRPLTSEYRQRLNDGSLPV